MSAMIRRLASVPLMHEPGARWSYGLSHDVLGRLVEEISGMPLDQFLRERIFEPLQMDDTYFRIPEEKRRSSGACRPRTSPNPAGGLVRFPDGHVDLGALDFSTTVALDGPSGFSSGGGGLFSTAEDYARFAQMLLSGGQFDGVRLLSRKTVEAMTSNQIGDWHPLWRNYSGDQFGLGVAIRSEPGEFDEI